MGNGGHRSSRAIFSLINGYKMVTTVGKVKFTFTQKGGGGSLVEKDLAVLKRGAQKVLG